MQLAILKPYLIAEALGRIVTQTVTVHGTASRPESSAGQRRHAAARLEMLDVDGVISITLRYDTKLSRLRESRAAPHYLIRVMFRYMLPKISVKSYT